MSRAEIERQALQREEDAKSKARLREIEQRIADLREKSSGMKAKWQSEKEAIERMRTAKAELEQIPGVSAVLTRTGDYFVPLQRRVELARKYQADVMISIHCNASRNHEATGTEVYFLSLTGATDEASRTLAESENAADLIGGISPQAGDDLLGILFDLRQNDTIRRSSELAENLVDALREEDRLKIERGVKQAGFVVLKAPDIPAVLVETAFITNPF